MHCMSKAFITICCCVMCVGLFMGMHLHAISLKMNSAVKCHLFAHSNHKTNLFTYDYVRDCASVLQRMVIYMFSIFSYIVL